MAEKINMTIEHGHKKAMPTLSIIIPVYNVVQYVTQCLDSILKDNHFEGEIICVNDGSTDGSLRVLKDYSDRYSNIVVIDQENKGLSEARNAGLRVAKGDYVAFIDSDDWLFPNTLDRIIQHIDGEDVLYYNARKVYEDTGMMDGDKDMVEQKHLSGPAYFAAIQGEPRNMPCVCVVGAFYLRDFLLRNHLQNELGIFHEDELFMPQVLLAAKNVSCVNVYLYAYRIRKGSITATIRPKNIDDLLFVARKLDAIYKLANASDTFLQRNTGIYRNILLYAGGNSISLSNRWRMLDSKNMMRGVVGSFEKKIAKLTFVSTSLAYRYMTNQLPLWQRKLINRFM